MAFLKQNNLGSSRSLQKLLKLLKSGLYGKIVFCGIYQNQSLKIKFLIFAVTSYFNLPLKEIFSKNEIFRV